MSQKTVGSASVGCPSEKLEAPPPAQKQVDRTHRLEFNFRTASGHPIDDSMSADLIHPDGRVEVVTVSGGKFVREGVPEGLYFLKFRYVKDCGWDESATVGEPDVHLWVTTERMPDGTQAEFRVFGRFQAMSSKPLAELKATIQNDQATAVWQYRQKLNEPPGGEFLFEVRVDKMRAVSSALEIWPFPVSYLGGVQQRLKQLGFDPGPTDGNMGPRTEAAVRKFQHSCPELIEDGIPGILTQRELSVATEF